MDPNCFLSRPRPGTKNLPGSILMHVCSATEPTVGGGKVKKGVFLKYLLLNSKLDILDNFRNDGTIFPTGSKKNQQAKKS